MRRWFDRHSGSLSRIGDNEVMDGLSALEGRVLLSAIPVTTVNDVIDANDGVTSLREAVILANADAAADEIILEAGAYFFAIGGPGEDGAMTGDLDILEDVTIRGAGSGVTLIDAGGLDSVFDVLGNSNVDVRFQDLTITGGDGAGRGGILARDAEVIVQNVVISNNNVGIRNGGSGGVQLINSTVLDNNISGISNTDTAMLTIENSTIVGNDAGALGDGGGIFVFNDNTVNIINSTISGNTAGRDGGGIYLASGGTVNITNSTISGNTATGQGGGIGFGALGDVTINSSTIANNTAGVAGGGISNVIGNVSAHNSIFAGNLAAGLPNDVRGNLVSGGYNLISNSSDLSLIGGNDDLLDVDPLLGGLADNGGPTLTHLPLEGSPAIDTGDPGLTLVEDQRGLERPLGGNTIDRGSVEEESVMQGPNLQILSNGLSNDLIEDADGNLHVIYHDAQAGTLRHQVRDVNGDWSPSTLVDNTSAEVGVFVDAVLADDGTTIGAAYYDAFNGDLRYAEFDGTNWTNELVHERRTVGLYPSVMFDDNGNVNIAYYGKTSGDLLFASNEGGTWDIILVDSTDDVGRYPSLATNPTTGQRSVAYENSTDGRFLFAEQLVGDQWNINTIEATVGGGGFTSLVFDEFGRPAVSYYDAQNADLKFSMRFGPNWFNNVVAEKRSQGLYTTLTVEPGEIAITFYNKTNDSLVRATSAQFNDPWAFAELATDGGRWARSVELASGQFAFTWFRTASENLTVQVIDL